LECAAIEREDRGVVGVVNQPTPNIDNFAALAIHEPRLALLSNISISARRSASEKEFNNSANGADRSPIASFAEVHPLRGFLLSSTRNPHASRSNVAAS
jgi:hypothetical protein